MAEAEKENENEEGLEEVALQREAVFLSEEGEGFAFSRREYLDQMINDKRFNEAENLLFSYLDEDIQSDNEGSQSEELISWFYDKLEVLSDDELEEGNFSREELEEGLQDALDLCVVEEELLDLADLLEF